MTATARNDDTHTPRPPHPTSGEILEELIDLSAGLVVVLLPLFVLSVPAIVLFVVLPGILLLALAAPVAVIGTVLAAPPYLLVRRRARRRRTASLPAGRADDALRMRGTSGQPQVRDLRRRATRS
jgi:Flp pilus assembly protein TadB